MAKNFDKLPIAKQRVIIAKDLIARLNAQKFISSPGDYLNVTLSAKEKKQETADAQIKTVLQGKVCRGCQIGGMFVCAIDRHNALTLGNIDTAHVNRVADSDMFTYLTRWFPIESLKDMEAAFECWGEYGDLEDEHSAKDRMRMIAQNIIKNKGKFIGKQLLA